MINIAIFASGSGSNAENIIRYFQNHSNVRIDSVWSNKREAYVLQRARNLGVEARYFTREQFSGSDQLITEFKHRNIDLIVLAGFLWLVPPEFVDAFAIINIHPALLPTYGGKGMYGSFVHESVVRNQEKESGITIHLVNKEYDKGDHLLQVKCPVYSNDTPETLAARIHELEYMYFPQAIADYLIKKYFAE
ncbi:MAG TPA: phosphoribosylglycinamide formyltransferase [Prolixibacteraceae bacterium]|nr:phosphoribosylglycinamide formyltransferase [Prolixibacteraceae bacterium]